MWRSSLPCSGMLKVHLDACPLASLLTAQLLLPWVALPL